MNEETNLILDPYTLETIKVLMHVVTLSAFLDTHCPYKDCISLIKIFYNIFPSICLVYIMSVVSFAILSSKEGGNEKEKKKLEIALFYI